MQNDPRPCNRECINLLSGCTDSGEPGVNRQTGYPVLKKIEIQPTNPLLGGPVFTIFEISHLNSEDF